MTHKMTAGRTWSSKKIAAVLGTAALGVMVVLPLAVNGFRGTPDGTPGVGVYSAFTLPPTMTEGVTETTTTVASVPAIPKAAPLVKAPHR